MWQPLVCCLGPLQIAMHTWSHHYSTGLTNEQFFAELWYTRKAIKDVVGVTATAW